MASSRVLEGKSEYVCTNASRSESMGIGDCECSFLVVPTFSVKQKASISAESESGVLRKVKVWNSHCKVESESARNV